MVLVCKGYREIEHTIGYRTCEHVNNDRIWISARVIEHMI